MNGAVALLIVNAAVAGLFGLSYTALAVANRSQRSVAGFGFSYLVGMLTPLAEIAIRYSSITTPFMIISYGAFLVAFLASSAALSLFNRQRPHWRMIGLLFAFAIIMRAAIWGGPRNNLVYELCYQAPHAAAIALCAWTAWSIARGRVLHRTLAVLFGLITLHFLTKPFLASMLGSGRNARDYTDSSYAVVSQAGSGILLIATGLVIMLIVIQSIVQESLADSETDPLSDLLNRRGLDRRCQREFFEGGAVVVLDLDHFKAINDTHGHDVGDDVIVAFADIMRRAAPRGALLARTGGEEFVVMLPTASIEDVGELAERIRQAAAAESGEARPAFTVSGGATCALPGETFADVMRRADHACYEAKRMGRNCVVALPPGNDARPIPLSINLAAGGEPAITTLFDHLPPAPRKRATPPS
ncbi:MAG: hypothetical protein ABT11_02205 [Novosphingobium sp. SCN 66-18]|nr:MAG: hypothetical protein ABT11_02205 [Novosphingobium sp. SCN 66-18]